MHVDQRQRGSALTAVLAATAVLLPLSALAVLLARGDLYVQHNARAQAEVFYAAEAGLEHAVSELPVSATVTDVLSGPDHRGGTADDGVFPFREPPPAFFPHPPLRYDVRVAPASRDVVRVISTGYGAHNARTALEALAARDPAPYVPAAVFAPTARDVAVGPDWLVSGFDHAPGDSAERPTGPAPAVPGLGVDEEEVATALVHGLRPAERGRIVGAGGAPSIGDVEPTDVAGLMATLISSRGAVRVSPSALAGGATLGSTAAPQVSVITGAVEITGSVEGAGVLIATGDLWVRGGLRFDGLVLAGGDVRFDADSTVRIDGSLWLAAAHVFPSFLGRGALTYDRAAIEAVDRWLPGTLPHAWTVTAWREVL